MKKQIGEEAKLELVKSDDQLPTGMEKQDLVKASSPKPVYVSSDHQMALQGSINSIELAQAQANAALARLDAVRSQQQLLVRDILDDHNVSRKTHRVRADDQGFFLIERIEKVD